LASDYSPTREQWLAAVDKVLKGKDFDRTLVTTTLDGLRIEPLYTADDVAATHDESGFPGFHPLTRGSQPAPRTAGQWDIRTRVAHPDAAVANAQILEDLANAWRFSWTSAAVPGSASAPPRTSREFSTASCSMLPR
jgi:methylmalonyl-CoA mutase